MPNDDTSQRRGPTPDYTGATGNGAKLAIALGDMAQAEAARSFGISPGFLNHLIHGRKNPGRLLAVTISERYPEVAVDGW